MQQAEQKAHNRGTWIVVAVVALAVAAFFLLRSNASAVPDPNAVLAAKCTRCHAAPTGSRGAYSPDQAAQLVQTMETKGAQLTPPERQSVTRFLSGQ